MRDGIAAAVLFAVAATAGAGYVRLFDRLNVRQDNFGQTEYAAAVAVGCGRGFVDLGYTLTPGLAEFLTVKRDRFSCAELPASVPDTPPNFTQGLYRYLMTAAGLVWRLRGDVSWSGLWPLFGLMYGCAVVAAFALLRAIVGRGWAIAGATAVLVSPLHLTHLPYLRDYSIGPFIMGALALILFMSARGITRRRLVLLAAAFGLVLGVGLGFRNDIAIVVPPFVAALLLSRPAGRKAVAVAGAFAAALLVFAVTAFPVVGAYGRGSNSGHVGLLGLMSPFDEGLGIRAAPYDWGYVNDDSFATSIVDEYQTRVHGRAAGLFSAEYDRSAMEYLFVVARHWPADMLTRAFASAIKVIEMPFRTAYYAPASPAGVTSAPLLKFYDLWTMVLRMFTGRGLLLMTAALLLVSMESVFTAVALAALVIYLAGYPALQFHVRHFFHLEFLAWAAVVYLFARLSRRAFWSETAWRPAAVRAGAFAAIVVAATAGSVAVLRAYQEPHIRGMVRTVLAAPRQPAANPVVTPAYLVAEFSPSACDAVYLPSVTIRYPAIGSRTVFSRTFPVRIVPGTQPTYVVFPAYDAFAGLELPRGHASCLTGVERVSDLSSTPVLPDLMLEPGWEDFTFAQTIASMERDDIERRRLPRFAVSQPGLVITARALTSPLAAISAEVTRSAAIVGRSGGDWIVRGRPDIPTAELMSLRGRPLGVNDQFVAQGEVRRGGISFALVDANRRVAARAVVTSPGPFLAAIAPPEDGTYTLEIHTEIDPWWPASHIGRRVGPLVGWIPFVTLQEDVTLSRMGWLPPA